MYLSVREGWSRAGSLAGSWGMHWQICMQSVRLLTLHQFVVAGTQILVK